MKRILDGEPVTIDPPGDYGLCRVHAPSDATPNRRGTAGAYPRIRFISKRVLELMAEDGRLEQP